MAKLRFSIHPLFFLFGIYFALTGRIFLFLTYTLVAVMHEMGHSVAAARLGYRLNRVVLMPYGAVIYGEIEGLKFKDEVEVALAGPLTNLACAILFAALWWVMPESYPFTDVAMTASLSVATVNLIPARPLDGGRILSAILKNYISDRAAERVMLVTGVAFSCVLGGLFVRTCFSAVNLSILFFALFVLFGTVGRSKESRYVKIFDAASPARLIHGAEVKKVAVTVDTPVKRLFALVDANSLSEVSVYDRCGNLVKTLDPTEVTALLSSTSLYESMAKATGIE